MNKKQIKAAIETWGLTFAKNEFGVWIAIQGDKIIATELTRRDAELVGIYAAGRLEDRRRERENPLEMGRPRVLEGGKRRQVYLDDASMEVAKRLGNGEVSRGIREALKIVVANSSEQA